ncbi:MAG TPA: MFS transporter [Solirubrobacteraceae bacterium]|jgi:CP family cyanate transporter-like MFS transporter|nr:MFS transporter [Solirubrobacteraceae bacterium]
MMSCIGAPSDPGHPTAARAPRAGGAVPLLAGIVLVAVNLRFAITSVSPVVDDVRGDLGLSSATMGLLTTTPLLALGLVAPLGPSLGRRLGSERVVLGCLVAIAAGVALRWAGTTAPLFAGTVVAGCGIAIGNVLVPEIVKHRLGRRAPAVMGIYAGGLSGGAALATGLTVPIEHAAGGSWRVALAAWSIPALLAALAWAPQIGDGRRGERIAERHRVTLWRDRLAWRVTLLMGLQSLVFYIGVAWLPDIFQAHGISSGTAGLLAGVGQVVGIPAGLLTSLLASRRADQRAMLLLASLTAAAGFAGVLIAPAALAGLWVTLLGLGQGGLFALALTLVVLRSPDREHAAELSSMTQSVGYTLAAVGPLLIGALHDLSGGWALPLCVTIALVVPEIVVGLEAARPGLVGGPGPGGPRPQPR